MGHGGKRLGAGRPKGQGPYKESTKPLRVPERMLEDVRHYVQAKGYQQPLYTSTVQAGFPSPADDHMDQTLDLNAHLIKHPAATFFVRAAGESMLHAGIHPGDLLVVDRSVSPQPGHVVIAALDGQLTVKRLGYFEGRLHLLPENPDFSPIDASASDSVCLWGVVTHVIHEV